MPKDVMKHERSRVEKKALIKLVSDFPCMLAKCFLDFSKSDRYFQLAILTDCIGFRHALFFLPSLTFPALIKIT
jgi:hypothetical protein